MDQNNLKKAFINKELRPKVSGQYYDINPPEYYLDVLEEITENHINNTRKRREIIIRLLRAKFLPQDMEYKFLLKDIFSKLLGKL